MGNQEVKLKGGAVDLGRIYEQKIAALLAIKCALDPTIIDFWLLSNIEGFGAFDDILLLTEDRENFKTLYCIQLKHTKGLKATQLEDEKGNFSIKKYYESYKEIEGNIGKIDILDSLTMNQIYLVLYTNAPLTGHHKTTTINLESGKPLDLLNTSTNPNSIFQLSNKTKSHNLFSDQFLKQFHLYADQASATNLDQLIRNELHRNFNNISNTVVITITDYFTKWSVGQKGKISRIYKEDIQMKLMELLLAPYTMYIDDVEEDLKDVYNILNETLTSFNVTSISRTDLLQNIYGSIKYKLESLCGIKLSFQNSLNMNLTEEQKTAIMGANSQDEILFIKKVLQMKQHFVPHLTVKDLYLAAWNFKIIPLIVDCTISPQTVEDVIIKFSNISKKVSFIMLNSYYIEDLKRNLDVFTNINDIKDKNLMYKNLLHAHVSLQGKKIISLFEYKHKLNVLEEITPDVYMVLMNGVLDIGEICESEGYYVKRDLKRSLLDLDLLNESNVLKIQDKKENDEENMFIIVEYNTGLPYKLRNNIMSIETYYREIAFNMENKKLYILTTTLEYSDEPTLIVINHLHETAKKSVHILKMKNFHLEWIYTKGSVKYLQEFSFDSSFIKEEEQDYISEDIMLDHFISQANVISNNAGMGKTSLLTNMTKKFDPHTWVCYINLSQHFSNNSTQYTFKNFVPYIFQYQLRNNDKIVHKFCLNFYIHCYVDGRIVWLLDGYDEVSSESVLNFVKEVKDMGIRLWVTTRPTYTRELELQLDTLSTELTHFNRDDYVTFLWRYFETNKDLYNYNQDQIQYIINTIGKCVTNLDKTLIAIPLQTRMFAEIFGDDINQVSEKERLTIVDLYNKFVNIKLRDYKSYESFSLKKTASKLALKLFYTEDMLDTLFDFEELTEEALFFQESYKKDSIVTGLKENGDAVFGHRSFAEFLAAHWLTKQIVSSKGKYNHNWLPLIDKLFYFEMLPIRIFFDRIICQDMPLHIAVLNNDIHTVKYLLAEQELVNSLDKLGRSALHLAVTYGDCYDLYLKTNIKGIRNVNLHSVLKDESENTKLEIPRLDRNEHKISLEILDILMERGFENTNNNLFQFDVLDFAMKSCSLQCLNRIYKKYDKISLYFDRNYNFKIFLYCIVYDNLHNIFSKRKIYDFNDNMFLQQNESEIRNVFKGDNFELLKLKYNDYYLTEIASQTGANETIYEILKSGALTLDNGNPVHKACHGGHGNTVEFLYKMGANVDKVESAGFSPLYQAGKKGRSDIIYQLLKDSKFLTDTLKNETLMTPLHYACQGGYLDCVKVLIKIGVLVNKKDGFGHTPLIYVNMYGYSNLIDPLLTSLAKEEINDPSIQSAINVASSNGYTECVKMLLHFNINVNNVDNNGDTPLILASKKGYPKVIEALAESKDFNVNLSKNNETKNDINNWCRDNKYVTLFVKFVALSSFADNKSKGEVSALHFACRHGHSQCVELLIDLGVNRNIEDTVMGFGYTPIIWAAMYGHADIIKILATYIHENTFNEKEKEDMELALIWTAILGTTDCTEILLEFIDTTEVLEQESIFKHRQALYQKILQTEFGLDLRTTDKNGNIPLLLAAKNGNVEVIKKLVEKQYRNNKSLNDALHWAAKAGFPDAVKGLIELGADEHSKDTVGLGLWPIAWAGMYGRANVITQFLSNKTIDYLKNIDLHVALNWAAVGGHMECIKILLDFGLDINNIDPEWGNTPLISACEYRGTLEVIQEFVSRNCLIDVKNKVGLTALDFAASKKKFDFVKVILNSEKFGSLEVVKNSSLFTDLQLALDWAVQNDEFYMIYQLTLLGIGKD